MAIHVAEFAVLLFAAANYLLQRENPGDGGFQVFVADLVGRVGEHGDFAPVSAPAGTHFVEEAGRGLGVAFVFDGNVFVGGANALGVDGVAGNAAGFFDDGFTGFGRFGEAEAGYCEQW